MGRPRSASRTVAASVSNRPSPPASLASSEGSSTTATSLASGSLPWRKPCFPHEPPSSSERASAPPRTAIWRTSRFPRTPPPWPLRPPAGLYGEDRGQEARRLDPGVAGVGRDKHGAALDAHVDPDRVEPVERHPLTHHGLPRSLGETVSQQLPRSAAVAGAVYAEPPVRRDAVLGALLRDDVGRVRVG